MPQSQIDMFLQKIPDYCALRDRMDRAEARLARVQAFWDDAQAFDHIVETGRYLKLCAATEQAHRAFDQVRDEAIQALSTLHEGASEREALPGLADFLREATRHSA